MFSNRTKWELAETPLARAVRERRAAGLPIYDLTASNPTRCGFVYDEAALLSPLSDPAALTYDPSAFGIASAREAVAAYYREHRVAVDPAQLCLTTSTSEAYSYLFRLLCDSGDEVLIAQPSYPLFDYLAALDDVRLVPYPLFYEPGHGWQVEPDTLRSRITKRTRAIALVHPNNPTGHFTSRRDRSLLENLCRRYDLALIVDEVFLDYPLIEEPGQSFASGPGQSFASGPHAALTFVLSGLSKVAALPQMKAAWIATLGPPLPAADALARLEVIADTFLSMNAPVQHALPAWLSGRRVMQDQILARTRANLTRLDALLAEQSLVSRLVAEAGWYVVLRVPALGADEEVALSLLADEVVIHPGSFFGFPASGFLVASLLPPQAEFAAGIAAVIAYFRRAL